MDSNRRNATNGSCGSAVAPGLTAEAAALFQEGINLLLSRWEALQMAVLNEWGGPHSRLKSQQLALDLFSLLTRSKEKVYIDDVEDFLDDAMLSLGTEFVDGSIEEIAENLMLMHEGCLEGDFSSIQKLRTTDPPQGAVTHVAKASSDSDSNDDNNDDDGGHENLVNGGSSMMVVDVPQSHSSVSRAEMMIDEHKPQSAEAEDGWTVVASKRNKGRRN